MLNRFKKWLPTEDYIKSHKHLRVVSRYLHDKDLWHITEKSTSRAALVGLFMAFVPVPFQMLLAVLAGLPLRANLLISVVLVWLSNPLTMGPMYYGCYLLGKKLLGISNNDTQNFHSISDWLSNAHLIWQPLLLGCFVSGLVCSIVGYVVVKIFWKVLT